ncbi:unnamed protein product [Nezara viridula]|uniref:Uncharacterized protein n=1 Tax=Nezara viridula TaxID=85310 RepID=A0A9P0MN46_NEZVI|nr:unnamed protein product [Nezara viridula]
MDQTVYGLVSKRAREEERTPADRLGQGDKEDLRESSMEESNIGEERVEADGTVEVDDEEAEGKEDTDAREEGDAEEGHWLDPDRPRLEDPLGDRLVPPGPAQLLAVQGARHLQFFSPSVIQSDHHCLRVCNHIICSYHLPQKGTKNYGAEQTAKISFKVKENWVDEATVLELTLSGKSAKKGLIKAYEGGRKT